MDVSCDMAQAFEYPMGKRTAPPDALLLEPPWLPIFQIAFSSRPDPSGSVAKNMGQTPAPCKRGNGPANMPRRRSDSLPAIGSG